MWSSTLSTKKMEFAKGTHIPITNVNDITHVYIVDIPIYTPYPSPKRSKMRTARTINTLHATQSAQRTHKQSQTIYYIHTCCINHHCSFGLLWALILVQTEAALGELQFYYVVMNHIYCSIFRYFINFLAFFYDI